MAQKKSSRTPGKGRKVPVARKPAKGAEISSGHLFGFANTETLFRAIDKIAADKSFDNPEEFQAFLNEHVVGRPLDEIVGMAGLDTDPGEKSRTLSTQAMSAETAEEALELAGKALELDPDNIDATMIQVAATSDSIEEAIAKTRQAIASAEKAFGPEFMAENKGDFWGIVETRPYMRARMSLLDLLYQAERLDEAVAEAEAMLDLNPNDNQGVRDRLLPMYLEAGRLEDARRLIERYRKDFSAIHDFGRVLERFLSGDRAGAEKALLDVHQGNPHVLDYFTGRRPLPTTDLPSAYSPGDEDEALLCMLAYGPVLMKYTEAMGFMVEMAAMLIPRRKAGRRRGKWEKS